jgi:Outer membrane lipoprotein LolB
LRWPAIVTAGLLCAGCAALRPPAIRPAPPAVLPPAAELDAALAARRAALHSLRALARLQYRDPAGSRSAREALIVARPDRVRIEILSLFGTAFVLTADRGLMTVYARHDGTVYRGRASLQNLQRYARLWLPLDDLVDVLLGGPPPRRAVSERVSFDAHAGAVRLSRALDRGVQVVWFSPAALPLAVEERDAAGDVQWRATFAHYRPYDGVPVATQVALERPAAARTLRLALQDVDVNPSLNRSVFAFQAPPGTKVVDLDRLED